VPPCLSCMGDGSDSVRFRWLTTCTDAARELQVGADGLEHKLCASTAAGCTGPICMLCTLAFPAVMFLAR
jgi:hypothetical protein